MVNVRGKGAMKDINFVARIYDNSHVTDKETGKIAAVYPEFSMDHRDARAAGQVNLNCKTERVQTQDGKTAFNNKERMTPEQVGNIQKVGSTADLLNVQGEKVGQIVTFKADGMISRKGNSIIPNTKSVKHAEFEAYSDIRRDQIASQEQAKASAEAAKASQSEAQAEAPEQVVEAATEEPSPVG